MALWFPIMVNNFEVGRVELVRTDPLLNQPEENQICTYSLKYYEQGIGSAIPTVTTSIEFPYLTRNPVPLLSAALERVRECQSTS